MWVYQKKGWGAFLFFHFISGSASKIAVDTKDPKAIAQEAWNPKIGEPNLHKLFDPVQSNSLGIGIYTPQNYSYTPH